MRDPSIHIRRSDFINIVQEYGLSIHMVDDIYRKASKFNIKNRVFVSAKSKAKRKSDRAVESDTKLLDQFNRIYSGCLLSANIKALTIGKTSAQFLTLKEVCFQAKEFSDLNGLGYEEGFKKYVEIGIKLLNSKFGIYRLKGTAQRILEYYQAKTLIESDPFPQKTDQVIVAWAMAVKEYFHTSIELEDDAQRVHFIHAREDADAAKADYGDWIFAQFEKYSYLNSIPAFSQFYGDQAKINWQLYMAKVKKENTTNEEQEYFKQVKNEKIIPIKKVQQEASLRKARLCQNVPGVGSENAG